MSLPTPLSPELIRRWIIDHHRRTGGYPDASTPGGRWAEADGFLRGLGPGHSLAAKVAAMKVGGWSGPPAEPPADLPEPATSPEPAAKFYEWDIADFRSFVAALGRSLEGDGERPAEGIVGATPEPGPGD